MGGNSLNLLNNLCNNMSLDSGKIYGFVGVIGSGKSYNAEKIVKESIGRKVIYGDFSEGIRDTVIKILTGNATKIDCTSQFYSWWKQQKFTVPLPFIKNNCEIVTGRQLLQRTGEHLKYLAGEDIWARYTTNYVVKQWLSLSKKEAEECNVIFGSLRFACEAKSLFEVSKILEKEVKIIFCDYHSPTYEINDHVSEHFAQFFLNQGCKDGQDITQKVKELVYGRI